MKIAVVLNKSISETKIVLEQIVTKFEKSGLDYEILDIDKLKILDDDVRLFPLTFKIYLFTFIPFTFNVSLLLLIIVKSLDSSDNNGSMLVISAIQFFLFVLIIDLSGTSSNDLESLL